MASVIRPECRVNMMYVLALASAAIADIMDQAKELDRQDMLGRVTVLRTKAQGDGVLWSLRWVRFPHSLLPHLGEKTSEFEIILAVRMEFLFGVIFD